MLFTPDQASTSVSNKPKVYVAGRMRGCKDNNFVAFYVAQAMLELWGYEVVNPARLDIEAGKATWNWESKGIVIDNGFTIEEALSRDFAAILNGCEAIFVLDHWKKSQGALRETWFGLATGRPLFAFDPNNPVNIYKDTPIPTEEHPYETHST